MPNDVLSQGDLRIGPLEVRLAQSPEDVDAAQALRYRVFYQEMEAQPTAEQRAQGRDFDDIDAICDHLLVTHHGDDGSEVVVGTYRLLRRSMASLRGGFYTEDEFNIAPLLSLPGEILELGRSCVDLAWRNRPTMQLLWRGIAAYVFQHEIEVMFGCGSLPGTDPSEHAETLSFLYYHHLAPPGLRPTALPGRFIDMKLLPPDAIDPRRAVTALPPLIKGYLRLNGFVGDGAVIDPQFNTTDVCVIVKTDLVTGRYARHYERTAGGFPGVSTSSARLP